MHKYKISSNVIKCILPLNRKKLTSVGIMYQCTLYCYMLYFLCYLIFTPKYTLMAQTTWHSLVHFTVQYDNFLYMKQTCKPYSNPLQTVGVTFLKNIMVSKTKGNGGLEEQLSLTKVYQSWLFLLYTQNVYNNIFKIMHS
jgi:hypothetical protein